MALSLFSGCGAKHKEQAYYLAPLQIASAKVSGVDLVTGDVTLNQSDIPAKKMLSFTRVYHSNTKDNNQTLGNFSSSFDKVLNPTFDYDKEPIASTKYATAQEACERGWDALAGQVYLGKLTDAKAVYDESKTVCDIYEAGEIKASMLIKDASTHALASSDLKLLQHADGTQVLFYKDTAGAWQTTTHAPLILEEEGEGYTLTLPNDTVEHYNAAGKLTQIESGAQSLALDYDVKGKLAKLTNSFGQSLTLAYDANTSRLKSLTSYDETQRTYSYDTEGRLATVTYPDGSTQSYDYDEAGRLIAVQDASGTTVKTYTYNDEGKVTDTANANGANAQSFTYDASGTTVTKNGIERAYDFLIQHSQAKVAAITEEEGISSYTYDVNGYPLSHTDKLGVTTLTTYNDRGLVVSRVRKAGTPSEEITLSSYHEKFHKPTKVVKAGVATFYSYNDKGQLTKKIQGSVNPSYKKLSAKKMFGYSAKMLKSTSEIQTKETGYAYNDQGLPSGTTLPNGAKTSTKYDESGNPTEQTNALGFTSKTTKFDKAGRALESIDINGKVTKTTYDSMGRVLTSTVDDQTTRYEYDTNGRVTKTTYPDGLETYSVYDAAGNTLESGDNQGAKTLNTYDANNNLIATETYKDSMLTNKSQTEYDSKNRVIATIDSFGNRTTTTYNTKGQKSQTTDALGRVTQYAYDSLGRQTKVTYPDGSFTQYAYNAKGLKTKVITPNNTVFEFAYDSLDRVTTKQSSDKGTTTLTYDISDNVKTQTDANGNTLSYEYDIGNRKTKETLTNDNGSEEVSYTYDEGDNAKGKLTTVTDSSGTTHFTYDKAGNALTIEHTANGTTLTRSFTYDDKNKPMSQALLSGKVLSYAYSDQGELKSIALDGQTLIEHITQSKSGLISYTYSDGSIHTRTYDTNGRVVKLTYPNYTEEITYNAVNNITQLKEDARRKEFDYDLRDRLTQYDHNVTKYQRFTYDPNGNRITLNQEVNKSISYLYRANSNILNAIAHYKRVDENTTQKESEQTLTYDKAGNIINDGTHTYTYDAKNRLVKIDDSTTYTYNYQNQRVSKTAGGVTTYYIYDDYKLIGEYQADGTPLKEYIYLGDTPIALLQNGALYFIYADHLNTPRRVTDEDGNILWSWESKPFGESAPNEDADNDGTLFTLNLRFPGQYHDSESNLSYNINRYYNPTLGRYLQSDPIGLEGGENTFGYVGGNPLVRVDGNGLVDENFVGMFSGNIPANILMGTSNNPIQAPPYPTFSILKN